MFGTREEWLNAAVDKLSHWFQEKEFPLPPLIKVGVGFTKGKGADKGIGMCVSPELTSDGTTHIFVCPTQQDPIRVLDILLHQLIHAAVGVEEKHRGNFKKLALSFGLSGKMSQTYAEAGSELYFHLSEIAEELKDYPHSGIIFPEKASVESESNWIRLKSLSIPRYKVVISRKIYEENGAPVDPNGEAMIPNNE